MYKEGMKRIAKGIIQSFKINLIFLFIHSLDINFFLLLPISAAKFYIQIIGVLVLVFLL